MPRHIVIVADHDVANYTMVFSIDWDGVHLKFSPMHATMYLKAAFGNL